MFAGENNFGGFGQVRSQPLIPFDAEEKCLNCQFLDNRHSPLPSTNMESCRSALQVLRPQTPSR